MNEGATLNQCSLRAFVIVIIRGLWMRFAFRCVKMDENIGNFGKYYTGGTGSDI